MTNIYILAVQRDSKNRDRARLKLFKGVDISQLFAEGEVNFAEYLIDIQQYLLSLSCEKLD